MSFNRYKADNKNKKEETPIIRQESTVKYIKRFNYHNKIILQ